MRLEKILGNKSRMKLISFLIRHPTKEYSQTELIQKTAITKATIIKQLNLLLKEDFIKLKKIGPTNIYRLDYNNIIVKQLKILDNIMLLKDVKKISEKYTLDISFYGSGARGEDIEDSDLDLLVIGKVWPNELVSDFGKLSQKIRRKISFKVFSLKHWILISKKDEAYYKRVEKDRIILTENYSESKYKSEEFSEPL